MNLLQTIQLYLANSKIAIIFGILLVFVALFTPFQNVFLSSGSIFFSYSLSNLSAGPLLIELMFAIIFLTLYALFVTLVVFSVRSEMSSIKLHYYVQEALRKFAWKLAVFYLVSIIGLALIGTILVQTFGISIFIVNAILLILSLLFLFGPQSIVVDEDTILESFQNSVEFILKRPHAAVLTLLLSLALVIVVQFIELYFDQFQFIGGYISIALLLLFVVPFIEVFKTQVYMQKYDLVADLFEFETTGHHNRR